MRWASSELKFEDKPTIGSGEKTFKEGNPLFSKFFVTCAAYRPMDDRDGEPASLYLHMDGMWMDSACSASGDTGYFDSRNAAEAAIQQAQ